MSQRKFENKSVQVSIDIDSFTKQTQRQIVTPKKPVEDSGETKKMKNRATETRITMHDLNIMLDYKKRSTRKILSLEREIND